MGDMTTTHTIRGQPSLGNNSQSMEEEDIRRNYSRHIQGVLHSIKSTQGGFVQFGRISLPASEDTPSVSVNGFDRVLLPLQAEQEGKEKLDVTIPMGVALWASHTRLYQDFEHVSFKILIHACVYLKMCCVPACMYICTPASQD
jgi:hypothetical protein